MCNVCLANDMHGLFDECPKYIMHQYSVVAVRELAVVKRGERRLHFVLAACFSKCPIELWTLTAKVLSISEFACTINSRLPLLSNSLSDIHKF
jgi:hypothetical protein